MHERKIRLFIFDKPKKGKLEPVAPDFAEDYLHILDQTRPELLMKRLDTDISLLKTYRSEYRNDCAAYVCDVLLGGMFDVNEVNYQNGLKYLQNNNYNALLIDAYRWIHEIAFTKNIDHKKDERVKIFLTSLSQSRPDMQPAEKDFLCQLLIRATKQLMMNRYKVMKSEYGKIFDPGEKYKLKPRFNKAYHVLELAEHHGFFPVDCSQKISHQLDHIVEKYHRITDEDSPDRTIKKREKYLALDRRLRRRAVW